MGANQRAEKLFLAIRDRAVGNSSFLKKFEDNIQQMLGTPLNIHVKRYDEHGLRESIDYAVPVERWNNYDQEESEDSNDVLEAYNSLKGDVVPIPPTRTLMPEDFEGILRPGRGFSFRDVVNCLNSKFVSLCPPCEVEVVGAKVKNLPITIHDIFINYYNMSSLNVEEAGITEICNILQKFYPLSAKYEKVTFFINDMKVEDAFHRAQYRLVLSVQVGRKKKDPLAVLFTKGRKVGRKKDNSNGS
jgi:hypothetical protein